MLFVCLLITIMRGWGVGVSLYLMLHADHAYDSRTCYCKLVNLKRIKLKLKKNDIAKGCIHKQGYNDFLCMCHDHDDVDFIERKTLPLRSFSGS